MKISEHFVMQEFVPPQIYAEIMAKPTDSEKLELFYQYVDIRIVALAEFYRSDFGKPITINNWHLGVKNPFTLRGFRPKDTNVGAMFSQHKLGRAFDCDIKGYTAKQLRAKINANQKRFYEMGLRRVETNVTWLHSDIKDTTLINKIVFFKP